MRGKKRMAVVLAFAAAAAGATFDPVTAQTARREVVTVTIPNTYVDVASGPEAWTDAVRGCVEALRSRGKPIVDTQVAAQFVVIVRLDTLPGVGAASLAGIEKATGRLVTSDIVFGRSPHELGVAVARRVASMMAAGPVRSAMVCPPR